MTKLNDDIVRILCFGDSNTWGYTPGNGNRYAPSVRWTGVLQRLLGHNYHVIEEALNGRTTDVDYPNRIGRNGRTYLAPCIESHYPLDWIILALGTNDTKAIFNRSAEIITAAIEDLIAIIRGKGVERPPAPSQIILVPPPVITEGTDVYGMEFRGAHEKSVAMVALYRKLAAKLDLVFVDLNLYVKVSPVDGVHYDDKSQRTIAEAFFKAIHK